MVKSVFIFVLFLFSLNVGFSIINTIYISSCGVNLNQTYTNGDFYELNQSITSPGGNCLNITSDNVSLDCKGFSITGNHTGTGIYILDVHNNNISNCNVNSFDYGVQFLNSSYNFGKNINSSFNDNVGFQTIWNSNNGRSHDNHFENITTTNNGGDGFRFADGSSSSSVNNLKSNYNGGIGVRTWSGGGNNITNFESNYNGGPGLYLASNYNRVINGVVIGNDIGFRNYIADYNYIYNVSFLDSVSYDMYFTTYDNTTPSTFPMYNVFNYTTFSNSSKFYANFYFTNNTFVNSKFLDATDKKQICFSPGDVCAENLAYVEQSTSNVFPSISVSSLILIFMGVVSFLFFN